ncbi:S8 family serine peptidase [Cellulomonas composti]|uniref:Peptidase S8/S53 domain-containing protein n=1 Tax=Cellulomonas composti TaxID=266130 RepID=A0A511J731_9CELL|nr:S8 family serine peptidase [Cellulomonas composti]GEL93499.1 hypothetical protein CCO02nite_01570 [Cellulomonas composti]
MALTGVNALPVAAADPGRDSGTPVVEDTPAQETLAAGVIYTLADAPTTAARGATPSRADSVASAVAAIVNGAGASARATASSLSTSTAPAAVDDGTTYALSFPEPVPPAEALDELAAVQKVVGVESAELDLVLTAQAASPVKPSDPYFSKYQFYLWDTWDGTYEGVKFPAGGYSTHAPSLWKRTFGVKDVVVAVVDTGSTSHAQLNSQTVAGYDMISQASRARDGNGRDANPQDQGDLGDGGSSSWHGTHVAGIIAAAKDGKAGLGNAPGVRLQHVRALGVGGGTTSDIAAAVRWAAGDKVGDQPVNKTPARVINLSLGGTGVCSSTMQDAINRARSRGAVVIVAAGNDATDAANTMPANCNGVITVASISDTGFRATYSNYGSVVDLAAPGGQSYSSTNAYQILSTWNLGTTKPGSGTWAYMQGTSMATPNVAGGAALIASLGLKGSALENAVRKAYSPLPKYASTSPVAEYNCNGTCGKGYFDLSKILTATSRATITGSAKVGKRLSVKVAFTGKITTKNYQWFRNGTAIAGATKASYLLVSADKGKQITVRVTPKSTGSFVSMASTSKPTGKVS